MYFHPNQNFLSTIKENWPLIVTIELQEDLFFPYYSPKMRDI
jgi:hypothetical protein